MLTMTKTFSQNNNNNNNNNKKETLKIMLRINNVSLLISAVTIYHYFISVSQKMSNNKIMMVALETFEYFQKEKISVVLRYFRLIFIHIVILVHIRVFMAIS